MLTYTIVGDEDGQNIVVFVPGAPPAVAHSSHPNYDAIVRGAENGDESILSLFDIATIAATKFERLSDRVTTANGRLYLDGDEIADALSAQVLRFLDEDVQDWTALVAFFENVQANPNPHSRGQLFEWLSRRDFAITPDGMIVGYKGVRKLDDGTLESVHSGRAIVNGQSVSGNVPNPLGAVVEMPRSDVTFDPAQGCSRGLHVGTYDYAEGWAQGALLEVHVNPRDVVSVPTSCDYAKVRVCRYRIVGTIDAPHTSALARDWRDDRYWGDDDDDDGDDF